MSVIFVTKVHAGQCSLDYAAGPAQVVKVDYVFDGDTVKLKDGRNVRFMSINTPELEREGQPEEPYAEMARARLIKMVDSKKLLLQAFGEDHYGRTLGYLFSSQGDLLSATLVREGLAYQIFMEAVDAYTNCLKGEEALARREKKGVWQQPIVSVGNEMALRPGFMVVNGRVKAIARPKKSDFIWIEMDGNMALRVSKWVASRAWLKQIEGQAIEARGWVKDRSKNKKPLKKNHKRWTMLIYQMDSVRINQ